MSEETSEITISWENGKWKFEPESISILPIAGYETTKTIKIINNTKFQFPEFSIKTNRGDCAFKTIRNLKPKTYQETELTCAIPIEEEGPFVLELIFEAVGSVPV